MTIDPSLFKEKFNNGKKIHCLLSSFSSVPNAIVILEKLNLQSWMFLAAGIGTEVSLGTVGKKSLVACTQLQMHLLNQLCSPYPNNCMSVAAHSSVPCHPASLEPHVLSKICINQFCAWCSLSAGQSRRLCMGTEHTICLIYLCQSHFPSPWEAWCAVSLQPTYPTQKCLSSSWGQKLK